MAQGENDDNLALLDTIGWNMEDLNYDLEYRKLVDPDLIYDEADKRQHSPELHWSNFRIFVFVTRPIKKNEEMLRLWTKEDSFGPVSIHQNHKIAC
jgi:hypothetical protein